MAATAGEISPGFRGTRLAAGEPRRRRAASSPGTGSRRRCSCRWRSAGARSACWPPSAATRAEDDEQLLLAFAASAATAVATARSVEAQRLRESVAGAEAERARWARELHDETLQGLGGLRMLVSAARRRDDADAMREALEEVVGTIDGEIEGLRTLIRELRPAALDELGPAPAIEELAARTGARHGLEVTTELAFEGRRSAEVETALYRIIQEALTNAVKHAGRLARRGRGARGRTARCG